MPKIKSRPARIATQSVAGREKTTEQLEEDLRKTREELAIQKWGNEKTLEGMKALVKELIQKGKEIEEVDKAKSEFVSIASHQLRTPVSGLSWLTEGLQFTSQNLTPKQKVYVKDLATLSKRLVELIEDLLDFSRLELKTGEMAEKNQIEIANFMEGFVKDMEAYADSKKHSIILNNIITGSPTIEINKRSFYNVLQNILSNSIEYSPADTAVTINLEKTDPRSAVGMTESASGETKSAVGRTESASGETKSAEGFGEASDSIKISISNKGPTIPEDEKPHIFERFYRGESVRKMRPEGTGLGLYIVKKVIEEIGGKVGFESEEGKDVVFWFTIPLKKVIINK